MVQIKLKASSEPCFDWKSQNNPKASIGPGFEWKRQNKLKASIGPGFEWKSQNNPKASSGPSFEWKDQTMLKASNGPFYLPAGSLPFSCSPISTLHIHVGTGPAFHTHGLRVKVKVFTIYMWYGSERNAVGCLSFMTSSPTRQK